MLYCRVDLRSKYLTANISPKSRALPNVYTEQGIYMLMTVLDGELAATQSKALIRTFKAMKDYIVENNELIGAKEIIRLSVQTAKNSADIEDIRKNMATKDDLKKVMANFVYPDTYKHFLILDGQKIEADVAYTKIYKSAKKSVYIVDNYIGLKTLELHGENFQKKQELRSMTRDELVTQRMLNFIEELK